MFGIGLGATLLFVALSDSITLALGRPIVPEVMVKVYQSADSPLLLILAMVILAPLTEELFFRGFLFEGLLASRLGPIGAVLLTSAAWSVVHAQYDLYGIATIFADGLLLGVIRWKTGSTLLTMVLHGLANLIAALEIEYWMLR
jgi:membrane protease YdiL (CAAX protease family)